MSRKILFICRENACRSQMAEAFARKAFPSDVEIISAGLESVGEINPKAIQVMEEIGISLDVQYPKQITFELMDGATRVVTMGCIDYCPFVPPGIPVIDWSLDDPAGRDLNFFRVTRDEIKKRVDKLASELSNAVG